MALKRLVRQEGAAGNVVDDVSVKHASSSDAVGSLTPSQIASASALNDINSNYIKTIKVNGIVQPKTNNEVNLPQWETINDLIIKNSPTDSNPVIYNGSGAVTLDLSQKVVVGDINTLLLQHGGTTAVQYDGKAPGAQTFNINTLTVNQGSSANQTTYNGGSAKTLNLQNLKIRNFQDTENASLTYNTSADKTLSFPRLQLMYLGTPYIFDTTPSASLGGAVSTLTLPTPTVSVGTLTLQQNGSTVGTYNGAATTVNFTTPSAGLTSTYITYKALGSGVSEQWINSFSGSAYKYYHVTLYTETGGDSIVIGTSLIRGSDMPVSFGVTGFYSLSVIGFNAYKYYTDNYYAISKTSGSSYAIQIYGIN
jgi:hypothetical protein